MKYKAIIFDLDGVICHTDHYHYLAWKQLADKLGVYFDEVINNRLRGVSRMESLEIILEKWNGEPLTPQQKEELASEKNEVYKALLREMSTQDLTQEVKGTLDQLRAQGLKLAIGSSSKNARLILTQIGLANYFDAISDGNNITQSKPHPQVFLMAADYIDEEPKYCLVVEDAKAGIDAAVAAGMDSAAIGDAYGYTLATYSVSMFSELVEVALNN
jgi:beta-phosphoglucomutase